jgi:hypothetical protein
MASAVSSYGYGGYGDVTVPPYKQDPVVAETMQDAQRIYDQATGKQGSSSTGSTTTQSTGNANTSSSANGYETTPEQAQTAASGVMGHVQDAASAIFSPQGLVLGGLLAGGAYLLTRGKSGGSFFSRFSSKGTSKELVVRRPTGNLTPIVRGKTPAGAMAESWGVNLPKYEGGKLSQAEFRQFDENYRKMILTHHPNKIPRFSSDAVRSQRQTEFDQMTQLRNSINPNT